MVDVVFVVVGVVSVDGLPLLWRKVRGGGILLNGVLTPSPSHLISLYTSELTVPLTLYGHIREK